MFESAYTEFVAERQMELMRKVTLPAAEQRAMLEHELALLAREQPQPRPAPLRWIGDRLIRIGERLRQGAIPTRPSIAQQ
jgi:hypothetical protein